jgi:hypothetical protein
MLLIIIIAFFAMRSLLKIGGICFSTAPSVLGYGIIGRFHGYLAIIWPPSWLPRSLSWALASLKLLFYLVGVFGSKGMPGFSKILGQRLEVGNPVLFLRSPCLSIG